MAGQLQVRRHRGPRQFRLHKPTWVDPFPQIPGTEPEKRIFAELVLRLHIFFIFQGQFPELTHGRFTFISDPGYKPDFILPEYRIVIDPFSPYHHSLPEAIARDATKIGFYTSLGYKVYHPWAEADGVFSFDQGVYHVRAQGKQQAMHGRFIGALAMLMAIPELREPPRFPKNLTKKQKLLKKSPGYELGPFLGAGATSVAAANRKRTKPKPLTLVSGTRRSRTRKPSGPTLGF